MSAGAGTELAVLLGTVVRYLCKYEYLYVTFAGEKAPDEARLVEADIREFFAFAEKSPFPSFVREIERAREVALSFDPDTWDWQEIEGVISAAEEKLGPQDNKDIYKATATIYVLVGEKEEFLKECIEETPWDFSIDDLWAEVEKARKILDESKGVKKLIDMCLGKMTKASILTFNTTRVKRGGQAIEAVRHYLESRGLK